MWKEFAKKLQAGSGKAFLLLHKARLLERVKQGKNGRWGRWVVGASGAERVFPPGASRYPSVKQPVLPDNAISWEVSCILLVRRCLIIESWTEEAIYYFSLRKRRGNQVPTRVDSECKFEMEPPLLPPGLQNLVVSALGSWSSALGLASKLWAFICFFLNFISQFSVGFQRARKIASVGVKTGLRPTRSKNLVWCNYVAFNKLLLNATFFLHAHHRGGYLINKN